MALSRAVADLHCGGGKRHHSGLYAESKDGLAWDKTSLDSGVTWKEGTVPNFEFWGGFFPGFAAPCSVTDSSYYVFA